MTPYQQQVLDCIKSAPISASAIAKRVGRTTKGVLYVVNLLRLRGLIVSSDTGPRSVWCLPELRESVRAEQAEQMLREAGTVRHRNRLKENLQQRERRAAQNDDVYESWVTPVQRRVSAGQCPPIGRAVPYSVFHIAQGAGQ